MRSRGRTSRDWYSLPDDGISYRERLGDVSVKGKRIALSPTLGYAEPAPAVREAVERAAAVFADLGAIVEPADPFCESPRSIFEPMALAGFWALLRAQPPEAVALMDPGLVAECRRGAAVTQEQYVEAVLKRTILGAALRQFFDRYDLLLSPAMPMVAPYADPRDDGRPNPKTYGWDWVPYTYAFNLTRNPSASIPCGFADGLPIGLMVTGPLYDDLAVLRACAAYETAVGVSWPSRELTTALANADGAPDQALRAKIRPVSLPS